MLGYLAGSSPRAVLDAKFTLCSSVNTHIESIDDSGAFTLVNGDSIFRIK